MPLFAVGCHVMGQRLFPVGHEFAVGLRTPEANTGVHHPVSAEGADVGGAEATGVTQVALLLRVHQGVAAKGVLPLEATAALATHKWSLCRVTRLVG